MPNAPTINPREAGHQATTNTKNGETRPKRFKTDAELQLIESSGRPRILDLDHLTPKSATNIDLTQFRLEDLAVTLRFYEWGIEGVRDLTGPYECPARYTAGNDAIIYWRCERYITIGANLRPFGGHITDNNVGDINVSFLDGSDVRWERHHCSIGWMLDCEEPAMLEAASTMLKRAILDKLAEFLKNHPVAQG